MYRNRCTTKTVGIPLFCIMILALLFLAAPAFAQESTTNYPNGNNINGMEIQGNYVWCSTHGSLVRWNKIDGTYRQFTTDDGLMSNIIWGLAISPDGMVWVLMTGYLQKFDGVNFTTYALKDAGLEDAEVGPIAFQSDGTAWIGTDQGYVVSFDGTAWKKFAPSDKALPATLVKDIVVDKNDAVWISYPVTSNENGQMVYNGVFSFDGTVWKQYTKKNSGLPATYVETMTVGADNKMWFGSYTEISSFDGTTWKKYTGRAVNDLTVDSKGTIWAAAGDLPNGATKAQYSLSSFDGSAWTSYPLDTMLDEYFMGYYRVRVDSDGTVWFVTQEYYGVLSLHRYDGVTVKTYLTDGPRSYFFSGISIDSMDRKWFGNFHGIACYDGKSWVNHILKLSAEDIGSNTNLLSLNYHLNCIRALAVDKDDMVWAVPLSGNWIVRYDGNKWKFFSHIADSTLNVTPTEVILVDRDNVKWFAGMGIISYDGKTWTTYKLYETSIITGAVDLDNVKWFCSVKGDGVWSFDGTTWTNYTRDNSPLSGKYIKVTVDKNNVKWFADENHTIFSFDGITWKTYGPEATGVPDDYPIDNLYVDNNNVLWATHRTLTSFDGTTWKSWPNVRTGTESAIAFDSSGYMWLASLYSGVGDSGSLSALKFSSPTTVEETKILPVAVDIRGNHPNPFNPSTTISFTLPAYGHAILSIYNITGQKVRDLVSAPLSAGTHSVMWDGRDASGKLVSSGVYLSRLTLGKHSATGRMLLAK